MSAAPSIEAVETLLDRPLLDLVYEAATVHRTHHAPGAVQCAQLASIKTGGCPEDCGYCSQSARFDTPIEAHALLPASEVLARAQAAAAGGADRFCMGAAWRAAPEGARFESVLQMVREVKALGLETCATLGMLTKGQAERLREAGLDYYNHNLDTGRSHYGHVVTTRTYDDRLQTLAHAREAGLKLCCGGILGLGEDRRARAELLVELAAMAPPPESVPINTLVPVEGTPMQHHEPVDWSEVLRTVAAARIVLPASALRLSAGRRELGEAGQALCFLAGANSIFTGDVLLTAANATPDADATLLAKLGLHRSAHATAAR